MLVRELTHRVQKHNVTIVKSDGGLVVERAIDGIDPFAFIALNPSYGIAITIKHRAGFGVLSLKPP